MKSSSFRPHVPNITGADTPLKEGELDAMNVEKKATLNLNALSLRANKELLECNLRKLLKKTTIQMSL